MKTFLLSIFLLTLTTIACASTCKQNHTLIEANNRAWLDQYNLGIGDTLEIKFDEPNGTATWIIESRFPLKLDGYIIVNGRLEIYCPSGIFIGEKALIEATGVKCASTSVIHDHGQILSPGAPVILVSPVIELSDTASIDTSSITGGGNVLIGGGFHGQDRDVPNAIQVSIASGASIVTDALGDGFAGDVVVWSDQATIFYGTISAKGVDGGGNVEVSSKNYLVFDGKVDVSSVGGEQGTLLIGP